MSPSDLPASPATEQRILACEMDRGVDALIAVIEKGVTPAMFSDPVCRRIQETVLEMHAGGLPFGLNDVWQRLLATPTEQVALLEITGNPDFANMMALPRLCIELRDLARRRTVMTLAARLIDTERSDPEQSPDLIGEILATQAESPKAQTWARLCDAATARAQDAIAGRINAADFVSWGWAQLDKAFKQMRRGELVVIAARPSLGKSSLARGIASAAALNGRPVLFATLEVSADDVIDGMATAISGHHAQDLARSVSTAQKSYLQAITSLRTALLQICEARTLAGIIARAHSMQTQAPLAILVVDYLGLISDCEPGKGETKAQSVGHVTKALKQIAMDLRIVVVCLAQLNRQSANDGNREPRLSDLRDSGDIEQDADRVIFIHRPDDCPITKRPQNPLDDVDDLPRYGCALIQAKGRNVGTGYGAVWFNRRLARFEFQP